MDNGFRWDASVIQTRSTNSIAVNQQNFFPKLTQANSGNVASRPCANNHDIFSFPVHDF
jgi:hypothetical protein